MNTSQNFLISIQGVTTENDILERFTGQLEHLSFSIQDLHYLNFQSSISILMRLELEQSTDKESLNKVLDKVAKQFKLELLIYPLPERSIAASSHPYFLTLLRLLRFEMGLLGSIEKKRLRTVPVDNLWEFFHHSSVLT